MVGPGFCKATMLYLNMALSYQVPEVVFLFLHPGWVATDSGNMMGEPPTTIQDCCQRLRYTIATCTLADTGRYWDINRDDVPL